MAQPTNTFSTYDNADNIAESVDNIIRNLDPSATPLLDGLKTGSASNTYEEWLTDTLRTAGDNAQIEGDDATTTASQKATRLGNYTQILTGTVRVSDTDEAVKKYGRQNELDYQAMKEAKVLKMELERAIAGVNNARVAGNDTTAREMASMQTFITTNTSSGSGGSDATGDGTDARTDGTQRAFTESLLKDVLQSCWEQAGDQASEIYTGAYNRGIFSGFDGNAAQVQHNNADKRIIATAKVYEGDFHTLTVVPCRNTRSRDALVLDRSMWEVCYLRPWSTKDLAVTGESDRKMVRVEATLKALNEKSSGGVFDLTTS